MRLSASEREKERKSQTSRLVDEGLKQYADWSAEERFYNRSRRIRRKIFSWLLKNVGQAYGSLSNLEADAANYADCSMPTARRWIFQWTRPDKPFEIQETTDLYIIRERQELEK